ncbi:MAG: hypothetical protein V4609_13620 [Pseudomonadota bacterium]
MNRCFRWAALGVLSVAVAACGGGGGGGGGAGETPPTDDPVAITPLSPPKSLAIDYDASNFTLRWDAVPGADGYEVLQDPDGPAGPLAPAVVAKVAGTSLTLPVAFADRLAAAPSYSVAACGGAACHAASSPVTPDLDATIGLLVRRHARAQDWTGYKLALSGDGLTLLASAPFDARDRPGVLSDPDADTGPPENGTWGAVLVFTRADPRSPWRQQAVLRPSNAAPTLQFGESLAISADGDTVAVGLPYENGGTQGIIQGAPADTSTHAQISGATYVFARRNGSWTEQAYIKSSTAAPYQSFGTTVALSDSGNTLAVGAPGDNAVADMAGAVHLFSRTDGVWSAQQILTASNGEKFDYLGTAVALSADGQTLAVSARWEAGSGTAPVAGAPSAAQTNNAVGGAGAVYVFARTGSGPWSQQAYVKGSRNAIDSDFGTAVRLSATGDTLAVGAAYDDRADTTSLPASGGEDYGAVYVFVRQAGVWTEQAYLKAGTPVKQSGFGEHLAVSASGDVLAVGAQFESGAAVRLNGNPADQSVLRSGAVYVFRRVAGQWTTSAYVKAPDTAQDMYFGSSVGLSADGGLLAIGAQGRKTPDPSKSGEALDFVGAVYLY